MTAKRVDFRVGSFDDMIDKHGYHLEHFKAIQCPCLNPETNHPDPMCPYCDRGWQYYDQKEIQGIITSLQGEKQFLDTGGMLIGTMQLTVKAEVELGYHDRVINRQSIINFSELMNRGTGEKDKGRFNMIEILRVVGSNGVVYRPLVDYVNINGLIEWVGTGIAPAEGERYSIAYKTHPSWLVLTHIHLIRDVNIKFRQPAPVHHRLPIQAVCKIEYLMEG